MIITENGHTYEVSERAVARLKLAKDARHADDVLRGLRIMFPLAIGLVFGWKFDHNPQG